MRLGQKVWIFIDETGSDNQSRVLAVTAVVLDEPEHIRRSLRRLRSELTNDAFYADYRCLGAGGSTKAFHFTDDPPAIREKVLCVLAELPFDAYACFAEKGEPGDAGGSIARLKLHWMRNNTLKQLAYLKKYSAAIPHLKRSCPNFMSTRR